MALLMPCRNLSLGLSGTHSNSEGFAFRLQRSFNIGRFGSRLRNCSSCSTQAAVVSRSRLNFCKMWTSRSAMRPSALSIPLEDLGDSVGKSSVNPKKFVVINVGAYLRLLPIKRVIVWALVALLMFQVRDFIGVIMGTIIISMVGNALVSWAEVLLPGKRRFLVAAMYALIIAAISAIGIMYAPKLLQEGAKIVARIQQNENPYSLLSEKLTGALGEPATDQLERFLLVLVKPDTVVLESMDGNKAVRTALVQQLVKDYSGALVGWLVMLISATTRFALQSLVSLVFSFMLVWDMPSIKNGIQSLEHSRFSFVYDEIAPVVAAFGRIFGKAIQAQSAIALANTLLTSLGLLIIGVSGVGWLSLLVFLCSFIPVAGVIMSTVPIGIVALLESGFLHLCLVVLMVIIIHGIEAYVLNPAIYSAHLHLHPLMALGVLVFAEHALGVWGLIAAVPLAVFFIEYVIKRKSCYQEI